MKCYKLSIFGAVQGVGFRPFIYQIATKLGLFGEVYNDNEGVKIIVSNGNIDSFKKAILDNLPPLARIDKIIQKEIDIQKEYFDFKITKSKSALEFSPILPDFAICDDCKKEFYDKDNPRYNYPFINCTNCGPRLSIIKQLPYDRKNTTMDSFKMCSYCQSEYENPLNRRYHAQPISCPNCGPKLILKDRYKNTITTDQKECIKQVVKLLNEGKILAIKGMGGFHLVCDASNKNSIELLRKRKDRPDKPFAIMCEDEKMANEFAYISKKESEILNSNLKPIVILKSKNNSKIPDNLAPNLNKLGIFLANTGLHLLIFKYLKKPIIATSANLSGEPIIFNEEDLLSKHSSIIDYYLDNDRDILTPSDDSITQIIQDKTFFLRTSRGINPKIFISNFDKKGCFLSIGAELKNQFVIYKDGQIFISPYIGDLKNIATFDRFKSLIKMFEDSYKLKFDEIIADLHPNFIHIKHFEKQNYKINKIQHHYAHLISALYDNNLLNSNKKFLGFCFDGTGYGDDGTIWGGEVFKFDEYSYERVYNFDEFLLLGGDSSIKNINKLAFSILKKYNINNKEFLSKFPQNTVGNLEKIYDKKINSFKTSSVGRIFDAFYSILFNKDKVSYDGQAGMEIEYFYDKNIKNSYHFKLKESKIIFKDAFLNLSKVDKITACSKFINGICNIVVEISQKENMPVVLSGGVFQNKTIVDKLINEFKDKNIEFYFNTNSPTNDSGIALGQMIWYLKNR
ncbi:[Ni-Fe] hydrogenase maturation protein HypF [Campylobacter blaseri]|uniref:Carbamoyltransferase n=1 Tax=Campylobacter blaseri TaxID=2042961 RepID=A0A2P8QYT9_9BACT|nr:carbamoyltransferase HypF [Campylobacter blaseri]PSM51403.1 carbamoyltransferase HypF [Campylobacter blaseri]PSM52853.1 carbamoyltransferase HypF [Campylobacter blaseri]QKF86156.1 [Ni-Fe] hydrogenase maturation protein HypF [Campylobacter blaseri]